MFIVLYRWRIKPEKEAQFIAAWSEITAFYRENYDSLGSRLHRGSDGIFYAYAQWKSESDREKAFADSSKTAAGKQMREAIAENFETVILEKLSDYLIFFE